MVSKSQLNGNLILRANNPMRLGGWCNPSCLYWVYNPSKDVFESLNQSGLFVSNCSSTRELLSIVADTRYLHDVDTVLRKLKYSKNIGFVKDFQSTRG